MKIKRSLVLAVVLLALLSIGPVSLTSASGGGAVPGTITVHKFHDVNGDGVQDGGEEDIQGWLIRVYGWDEAAVMFLIGEGLTGFDGTVTFSSDIPLLKVKVWEEERECWEPTTPPGMNWWNGGYYVEFYPESFPDVTVEFGNVDTCAPACQTDLIAGQDWDSPAGVVTVYDDGTNLYVTFDTTGWVLGETHLYVGTSPPKKSAPGQFPYSSQTEYVIPLSDFGGATTLYIAAHAVVSQGDQSETAWADSYGTRIPRGGWGMYFGYNVGVGCFTP